MQSAACRLEHTRSIGDRREGVERSTLLHSRSNHSKPPCGGYMPGTFFDACAYAEITLLKLLFEPKLECIRRIHTQLTAIPGGKLRNLELPTRNMGRVELCTLIDAILEPHYYPHTLDVYEGLIDKHDLLAKYLAKAADRDSIITKIDINAGCLYIGVTHGIQMFADFSTPGVLEIVTAVMPMIQRRIGYVYLSHPPPAGSSLGAFFLACVRCGISHLALKFAPDLETARCLYTHMTAIPDNKLQHISVTNSQYMAYDEWDALVDAELSPHYHPRFLDVSVERLSRHNLLAKYLTKATQLDNVIDTIHCNADGEPELRTNALNACALVLQHPYNRITSVTGLHNYDEVWHGNNQATLAHPACILRSPMPSNSDVRACEYALLRRARATKHCVRVYTANPSIGELGLYTLLLILHSTPGLIHHVHILMNIRRERLDWTQPTKDLSILYNGMFTHTTLHVDFTIPGALDTVVRAMNDAQCTIRTVGVTRPPKAWLTLDEFFKACAHSGVTHLILLFVPGLTLTQMLCMHLLGVPGNRLESFYINTRGMGYDECDALIDGILSPFYRPMALTANVEIASNQTLLSKYLSKATQPGNDVAIIDANAQNNAERTTLVLNACAPILRHPNNRIVGFIGLVGGDNAINDNAAVLDAMTHPNCSLWVMSASERLSLNDMPIAGRMVIRRMVRNCVRLYMSNTYIGHISLRMLIDSFIWRR